MDKASQVDPASSEKTYLRRFPCWWRKTARKDGLHQSRLGRRPHDAPPASSWAAPARRPERRSPRRRDPAGEAVPMILRLVDQPLAEAITDHVQWTPRSGACSRGGASAVRAQAQAQALCDQQHGAFPELPSSGSAAPKRNPTVRDPPQSSRSVPLWLLSDECPQMNDLFPRGSRDLLSHGCQQMDDLLEH